MTLETIRLPNSPDAWGAAARYHLDSAKGLLDRMHDTRTDVRRDQVERDFWQHMNVAWELIQRVEGARRLH
ncbi:hypothetical protein [Sphingobium olei]|uniref:Uncharacterized protein n=1 Tax=Sphingobium olei TaxID=420955 RepID=A0ABW3NZT6_9SPHN